MMERGVRAAISAMRPKLDPSRFEAGLKQSAASKFAEATRTVRRRAEMASGCLRSASHGRRASGGARLHPTGKPFLVSPPLAALTYLGTGRRGRGFRMRDGTQTRRAVDTALRGGVHLRVRADRLTTLLEARPTHGGRTPFRGQTRVRAAVVPLSWYFSLITLGGGFRETTFLTLPFDLPGANFRDGALLARADGNVRAARAPLAATVFPMPLAA